MLGTSNEIKNPGLRILPPGVERYFVKGGGLSVIEIFAEDKIDIINEEGKQICEIIVFDTNGKPDLSILNLKQNANADFSKRVIANDEKITKIFHFSRADLAHIKYYLKTDTNNVLDTKIASKLARSYSDNHSLKTLIKEFINIDISKQFQNSDFGGELTPSQLKYCANDVIYLHKIHEELNKILERENRIKLYQECLKFLKIRVDLDLALFKDDIWSH